MSCIIYLDGLTAGMNGDKGLIRQHWSIRTKLRNSYTQRLRALAAPPFLGQVELTYTRTTSRFMDWDNAASSFKLIGDSLVLSGILKDDSPEIITEFTPRQIKCKKNEESMQIIIQQI